MLYADLRKKHDQIMEIAKSHGVEQLQIFGSVARGEEQADSDIDFLVSLEKDRSLFDLVDLKDDLEKLLGRPVDVVTENAVHWKIRDQILNEAVPL